MRCGTIAALVICILAISSSAFPQAMPPVPQRWPSLVELFSESLETVIEASGSGFSSIKGAPDPTSSGKGWFSTVGLPSSNRCLVWIHRDHSRGNRYSCEMVNFHDAQDDYRWYLQIVRDSLPGWTKSHNPETSTKTTKFTNGSLHASVTLRLTKPSTGGYSLFLDVDP